MHDLGDLDWLSLTLSLATFGVCHFSRLDSFYTISTQRKLYASGLFLLSLVPRIDKPWGSTLRENLHEPCACGIQIGGAKERQQPRRSATPQPPPSRAAASPRAQEAPRARCPDPGPHLRRDFPGAPPQGNPVRRPFPRLRRSRTSLIPSAPPQDPHGSIGRISRLGAPPHRLLLELRPSSACTPPPDLASGTSASRSRPFHVSVIHLLTSFSFCARTCRQ